MDGTLQRIGEIPFTSQRKMMSVLVVDHADGGARALAPGALMSVGALHRARRGEGHEWCSMLPCEGARC
ncbi:MAG: hypothetical protein IPH15_18210 [Comamonadaceae bacterium]|nr:hypothetical protein [Comamonadaceae bacterium]